MRGRESLHDAHEFDADELDVTMLFIRLLGRARREETLTQFYTPHVFSDYCSCSFYASSRRHISFAATMHVCSPALLATAPRAPPEN